MKAYSCSEQGSYPNGNLADVCWRITAQESGSRWRWIFLADQLEILGRITHVSHTRAQRRPRLQIDDHPSGASKRICARRQKYRQFEDVIGSSNPHEFLLRQTPNRSELVLDLFTAFDSRQSQPSSISRTKMKQRVPSDPSLIDNVGLACCKCVVDADTLEIE